jgi:cytochrome c-type protein NapB
MGARSLAPTLLALVLAVPGCRQRDWVEVPGSDGALKSSAQVRSERRLYDGAPPTIPHMDFGAACAACHDDQGIAVEGVGFAPPSPHEGTPEAGVTARCRQCHVFVETDRLFVENTFAGLEQDLRPGSRLYPGAPPTIPHKILMRENCSACHAGPAAREEIRTTHPERIRCRQCHVPVTTREVFAPGATGGEEDPEEP